jgi:hypothetical protein
VGFLVDKVALGQVFSEYFGFPCQFSFQRWTQEREGSEFVWYDITECNVNSVFMVPLPVAPDYMRYATVAFYILSVPFQNILTSVILSTSDEGIRNVVMG